MIEFLWGLVDAFPYAAYIFAFCVIGWGLQWLGVAHVVAWIVAGVLCWPVGWVTNYTLAWVGLWCIDKGWALGEKLWGRFKKFIARQRRDVYG